MIAYIALYEGVLAFSCILATGSMALWCIAFYRTKFWIANSFCVSQKNKLSLVYHEPIPILCNLNFRIGDIRLYVISSSEHATFTELMYGTHITINNNGIESTHASIISHLSSSIAPRAPAILSQIFHSLIPIITAIADLQYFIMLQNMQDSVRAVAIFR